MEDLQKAIQKPIEESLQSSLEESLNKPIYEFVATYDAGSFTKYIGSNI